MTGILQIDWLTLSLSLFNTGLLAWLGLTVLLTAQPRSPGAIAASLGLLVAAAFFVSHSAIVGQPLHTAPGLEFLWRASFYAVIALPAAWYGVVLWYSGYWSTSTSALRRRHTPLILVIAMLVVALVALTAVGQATPTLGQALTLDPASPERARQMWLFGITYPVYGAASLGAALDALLRPGPVTRATATPARRRARPWLLAASSLMLIVSLVASFGLQAATQSFFRVEDIASRSQTYLWLVALDLLASGLIGLIGLSVGQALAEYEVFTGRSLPRRGLRRYWRRAVLLCAGISPPVAFAIVRRSEPIYAVLLALLILIAFYALVSWRSFIERERTVDLLRPLTAEALAWMRGPAQATTASTEAGIEPVSVGINAPALFTTLCRDSVGAERGVLMAEGPLAPLAGAPIQYPPSTAPIPEIDRPQLYRLLTHAGGLGASLDPVEWHGLQWAVQLWSERGPIGVMLLGRKQDGGLYAQEDIEVARAGGERLLEAVINTELANRLIVLQRRRLSEGQVLDQRLRRELHDEVLPRLHAAMLTLGDTTTLPATLHELAALHHRLSDLVRAMPNTGAPELRRHGFPGALRQVIEGELAGAFTGTTWDVDPAIADAATALPGFAAETLYFAAREALRNAASHGRGGDPRRPLQISLHGLVEQTPTGARLMRIGIRDDGVGVSPGGVTAGTQHGLTLHTTLMAMAGGGLEIASRPGGGTLVDLRMPIPEAPEDAAAIR